MSYSSSLKCLNPKPPGLRGLAFSLEGGQSQIYRGGRCHKIFDDQNVESHKMTTDSVFILFKKTDFNTILACLGGTVYR